MRLPAPGDLSLERGLVELRIAESREVCGPALHRRNKSLLANDNVRDVGVLGSPGEVQTPSPTRARPRRVDRSA